jgi:hypothetical protein
MCNRGASRLCQNGRIGDGKARIIPRLATTSAIGGECPRMYPRLALLRAIEPGYSRALSCGLKHTSIIHGVKSDVTARIASRLTGE